MATPEELAQLLQYGNQTSQIGMANAQAPRHWAQALAGALQMGIGGQAQRSAAQQEGQGRAAANQMLAQLLSGQGDPQAAMADPYAAKEARAWMAGAPQREAQQFKIAQAKQMAPLERKLLQAQIDAAQRKQGPEFGVIGEDAYGRKQYGFVSRSTGQVQPYEMPAPAGGMMTNGKGVVPGLTPELQDLLSKQPPKTQTLFAEMWRAGKPDKAIEMLRDKPLAAEAAARVGLLRQAGKLMPRLRQLWIEDGKKRSAIGETSQYYTSMGDVGEARRLSSGAMEGILRAATGAAVTPSEEARYTAMFVPAPYDTMETRERKLNSLERFISSIEQSLQEGRPLTKAEVDELASKTMRGLPEEAPAQPQANGQPKRLRYNPATGDLE